MILKVFAPLIYGKDYFVMEDLISVIVPVYNVEKYLNRCVDSIINQTYKNLEIILVDDGSPDNCGKICDEYAKKDKRIKVIHKENGGQSDARNKGIEIAKGKYVGFVDSDDWIDKNMYEILYKNITKYNCDLSTCNFIRTYQKNSREGNNEENIFEIYTQDEYIKKFFKIGTQECVYYPWNKLYKKKLLERNQYPVGLTSEDVEGTFKYLLKCKQIVTTKVIAYNYFYNNESTTKSKFSNKDLELLTIWDNVVLLAKDFGKKDYIDWAILNRERINMTILYRMAKQLTLSEIEQKYGSQKKQLIKQLKIDKRKLLKSDIPLSRKVAIIIMCRNYSFFVKICKIL